MSRLFLDVDLETAAFHGIHGLEHVVVQEFGHGDRVPAGRLALRAKLSDAIMPMTSTIKTAATPVTRARLRRTNFRGLVAETGPDR